MKRLISRRTATLGLAPVLAAPALRAQPAFPNKPLRMIVPYPPGGSTDIIGRLSAEAMGQHLGKPIVVENRPGAGGNIGALAAAQAEPDGYTLFIGTMATHGVNPVIYPDSRIDAVRDFAGVGLVADQPNVLTVNPRRLNVTTVAEVLALARQRPGQITCGSVGNGSSAHLSLALLQHMTGLQFVHVPYRGSSPAIAAMLAGDIDLLFDASISSTSHIRAGSIRALAITMNRRLAALAEVPTLDEAGVPGYHLSVWNGVFTQSRVPQPNLARLQAAFEASMDTTMIQRLRANAVEPLIVPSADLPRWLAEDQARWMRIARETGIRPD
jgi:tripartite-type tricarboxylate transporter receptor subunit TctC